MRKLLVIMLLASNVMAYEVKDNPDRIPSLGLTYTGSFLKGDLDYETIAWSPKVEYKQDTNTVLADLRLPANRNLTFEIGGGFASSTIESIDGSLISLAPVIAVADHTKAKVNGPVVKAGARYYFQ